VVQLLALKQRRKLHLWRRCGAGEAAANEGVTKGGIRRGEIKQAAAAKKGVGQRRKRAAAACSARRKYRESSWRRLDIVCRHRCLK